MAPKLDIVSSRGRFNSLAPSQCLISSSDDERDHEYVPPGTQTLTSAARATRGTPKKVAPDIVAASECVEESILNDKQSRSALGSKRAFGYEEVSGSMSAHSTRLNEATAYSSRSQGSTFLTEPA